MQYGQNISIPYAQQQTDHNNMFNNDHKNNILKTKMERDRDDGKLYLFFFFKQFSNVLFIQFLSALILLD